MLESIWKTIEGKPVVITEVLHELLDYDTGREVHIGTDSQQAKRRTEFVTVIAVVNPGKGARAFYCRETVPKIENLRERLMKEVWFSVDTGLAIVGVIPNDVDITVHIDANPNLRYRSSNYVKELTALVVSQGFKSVLKPDSFIATHAADHVVKQLIEKRR